MIQVEPEPLLHALFVRDIEEIGVCAARTRRCDLLSAAIASIAEAPPYHGTPYVRIGKALTGRSANIDGLNTLVRLAAAAVARLQTIPNRSARGAVFVGLVARLAGIRFMADGPRKPGSFMAAMSFVMGGTQ